MAAGDMSPGMAKRLAALIVANAEQLQDRAEEQGVTAFLGRAVQRERPNERFLQNTIKNLASANRRADERAMWAAWEAQQQQEQQQQEQQHCHCQGGGSDAAGYKKRRRGHARSDSHSRGLPADRQVGRDEEKHSSGRHGSRGQGRSRCRSPGRSRSRSPRRRRRGRSRSPSSSRGRRDHECPAGAAGRPGTPGWAEHAAGGDEAPAAGSDRPLGSSSSSDSADGSGSMGATAAADAAAFEGPPDAVAGDGADDTVDEDDGRLLQWLSSSKSVRGRGASGPSGAVAGPYLQPPSDDPAKLHLLQQGVKKGPEKPAWLLQAQGADAAGQRLAPDTGFLQGIMRAQGLLGRSAVGRGRFRGSDGVSSGSESGGESSSSGGSGKHEHGNRLHSGKVGSSGKRGRDDVNSSRKKSRHKGKKDKSKKRRKKDKREEKSRHKHKSRD